MKPVLLTFNGSRFFGTEAVDSDLDCDGIFVPDFSSVKKIFERLSPATTLYLNALANSDLSAEDLQHIESLKAHPEAERRIVRDLLIEFRSLSFSRSQLLDVSKDRESLAGKIPELVDLLIHPPVGLARQLSGENMPTVRTQMLLLALTCEDSEVLGQDPEKTREFQETLRRSLLENRTFYFEINRHWDLWWRHMAHPTGGLQPKKIEKATDEEFAARDKMLYDLFIIPEADPKLGYDLKRAAMLITTVQAWNDFYAHGQTRGWRKSAVDTDFVRSIREGRVDYVTFASYRNLELEKLLAHSTRFQSQRLSLLCTTDVLEGLARLPALL